MTSLIYSVTQQLFEQYFLQTEDKIMPKPKILEPEKLIGTIVTYPSTIVNDKDAILYALGIGFSTDPLRTEDYPYTYESHEDFTIFPTMGVVIPKSDLFSPLMASPHVPEFSPFSILHAGQKLTIVKPKLQIGITYQHELKIADCVDKGKNAFVLFQVNSYTTNQKGQRQLAFFNQFLLFIRGLGGFNYPGKGLIQPKFDIPKRNPDYKFVGQTYPSQAFVYRLSGDLNPLHIDPEIAKGQKFERPIIHGLASYGTVARVLVQELLKNDSTRLKSFNTTFSGHVFPGETLDIHVWKKDQNTYFYQAQVQGRKTKAIVGSLETRPSAKL